MTVDLFRKKIEEGLEKSLVLLSPPSTLREACSYALKNGGKRMRPLIVLMTSYHLNPASPAMEAALAVEFCHTATLIADDLPCMDNELKRRGQAALHHAFSEEIALLATYVLIAAGYEKIGKNFQEASALRLALETTAFATGICGVSGGQFLDLNPPSHDVTTLCKILAQKSGALFELAFVLGWLSGGGDPKRLPLLKKAGHHLGMAFQLSDDFDDLEEDQRNGNLNLPLLIGKEESLVIFNEEKKALRETLRALDLLGVFSELLRTFITPA